jgi:ketosteroid isomerase-like protein
MHASDELRDALRRFYALIGAGDGAGFDEIMSPDSAVLVIGTAPGEWVRERERLEAGFRSEGVRIEPGEPAAWSEGTMGWAVDQPTFRFGGSPVRTRLTSVWHRHEDRWTMVHMHVSVGVPDDEVTDLQRRWGTGAADAPP